MSSFLSLPGSAGNYASVPDSAALSITGDIDLRCELALDDWTGSDHQTILSKEEVGDLTFRWIIVFNAPRPGSQQCGFSVDGSNLFFPNRSDTAVDSIVANGEQIQLRVTRVAATGVITYFYKTSGALDSDSGWTADGTDTATSGNLADSGVSVKVGAYNAGGATRRAQGEFYRVIMKDGIAGTVVLDANFADQPPGTTEFAESSAQGATVTINQSGSPQAEIVEDLFNKWDNIAYPFTVRENRVFDTRVRAVSVRRGKVVSTTPANDYD